MYYNDCMTIVLRNISLITGEGTDMLGKIHPQYSVILEFGDRPPSRPI